MFKKREKNADTSYPVWATMKRLIQNVTIQDKKIYAYFAAYTLLGGVYPMFAVAMPKLTLDELTRASGARVDALLWIVAAVFVASAVCGYVKTYLTNSAYFRLCAVRLDYIRDCAAKIIGMDYQHIEDASFYNDHERAMSAANSNQNGIEGVYHQLFEAPAEALTALLLIAALGTRALWIVPALILNIWATMAVSRKTHAYRHSLHKDIGKAHRRIGYYLNTTHDFGFGKDIRIYGLKDRVTANYRREIDAYVAIQRAIARREFALSFLALGAMLVSDAVTYGVLIGEMLNGLPIADFSMALTAVTVLSATLTGLSTRFGTILNEGHYAHDFYQFMDTDFNAPTGSLPAVTGDTLEITFDNVSFKYPKTDRYIIRNLNFTIQKGERVAIVGINGAGKSTLVKLMTGLFRVTEGEIRINGIPIGHYDPKARYSMFSVVFQDVNVLAYPLAENVACREGGDRDRVTAALDRAGLGDKVRSLPKGIDQPMLKIIEEDGTEFSGGESQKLAIARALYKGANMVIMDEPTAALDALAEADIYRKFSDLVEGKTAVYISHRLASTKFCDRIAFFDADGLKECGSHDELMAKKGAYHRMFTVQGKYYNLDPDGGAA